MKAQDILVLDVRRFCSFADILVICSGTSRIQLKAIAAAVEDRLSGRGLAPLFSEGRDGTGWVILDYGDVVAHIMIDEARRHYNLERLWGDGQVVEWRANPAETVQAQEGS
jgi:ribosome-associated protein